MAIGIPIYSATEKQILKAVSEISKEKYQIRAKEMQLQVRATDGIQGSVELMNRLVLRKLPESR